jgi:hypothetical protein
LAFFAVTTDTLLGVATPLTAAGVVPPPPVEPLDGLPPHPTSASAKTTAANAPQRSIRSMRTSIGASSKSGVQQLPPFARGVRCVERLSVDRRAERLLDRSSPPA